MAIAAVKNAQGYAWKDWLIGIMRSFLSGGAAALAALGGSSAAGATGNQIWKITGFSFVVMGLYRMGEFLQLHGAPDKLQQALDVAEDKAKEAVGAVQEAKAAAPTESK